MAAPLMKIVIKLEGSPQAYGVNMETEDDKLRMAAWLNSNPETRELVDWIQRWHDEGRVNTPATITIFRITGKGREADIPEFYGGADFDRVVRVPRELVQP